METFESVSEEEVRSGCLTLQPGSLVVPWESLRGFPVFMPGLGYPHTQEFSVQYHQAELHLQQGGCESWPCQPSCSLLPDLCWPSCLPI